MDAPPPAVIDASVVDTAPPVDAALGAWSTPVKVDVASSGAGEDDVTLSSNTLELFFAVSGGNGKDLFYSSRATPTSAWTTAVRLPFNSAMQSDETPRLSADDQTLYFASGRNGSLDVFQVTRAAPGSTTWGTPTTVAGINTSVDEKWFMPCGSGHYVLVRETANNGTNLFEGDLGGGAAVAIATLNEPAAQRSNETGTFLTPDCLTIYFASNRVSPAQIFRAQRASLSDAWPAPTTVNDFAIAGGNGNQEDPWVSSDERTFAFASDAASAGNKDLYLSTR
jgi:Tol biopolymer transport system component